MNLTEAYEAGKDRGYAIAINTQFKSSDPSDIDAFIDECFESESNSRSFSPFEHTASAINQSKDPDRAWVCFQDGINVGINKAIRELKRGSK